ncbi:copper-binding protein [Ferrigenium sp. UT5]|uniref:copper-binding protein n=1 Tax=Ferrigenium sp. UT5 TaxID=3242105 RepID=UPI00354E4108
MKFATFSIAAFLLATSTAALAVDHMQHMSQTEMHQTDAHVAQTHRGHGTVNKIDLQHNTVNMTHGPIKSLGWPGMTMDFKVKDAAILKDLKPGQNVMFEVVNEGPRRYFVTHITPQK